MASNNRLDSTPKVSYSWTLFASLWKHKTNGKYCSSRRIDRNHFEHLQGVIQGSVPCDFLKNANRDVEQQKGVRGILADMATFEVEQPG